jgi:hypothetical protein
MSTDDYTNHSDAVSRASMTLNDWINELVCGDITNGKIIRICDNVNEDLIFDLVSKYLVSKKYDLHVELGIFVENAIASAIETIAEEKMAAARDAYEEEYGRRP